MKPKVTIIVPVYNATKFLRETVNSIINQSYKNLEIIFVDDGSTDDTVSILKEYAKEDKRIQIFRQENQYAGVARNNGIEHATGEYVMFLDSDDIFDKKMVSYLVRKAEKYDPDIITFGYYRFIETVKRRRPVRNKYKNEVEYTSNELKDNIFQMTRSMPWDKFIKRELIEKSKVRYQNTKVNNDIFFNRVIVTEANKILFCGKRLVNYRINNEQSLQGKLNKNPTDFLKGNLAIYKELEKRGTYKEYQSSFEKMIVDDIIFHLKNVSSYDEFEKIFNEIKNLNFLEVVGITENTDAIQEHEYKNTLEGLYENQPSKCLAALYSDYKKSSTVKTSAEYIIGKKILGILKMSF